MDILLDYLAFVVKTVIIVAAIIVVFGSIIAMAVRSRQGRGEGNIEIQQLNKSLDDCRDMLHRAMLSPFELRQYLKQSNKKEKKRQQSFKKAVKLGEAVIRKRMFYIKFKGNIQASSTVALRNEISAILTSIRPEDEVLVSVESGGGLVSHYGLAASQLQRIRDAGATLTVAVDKIAASGGYLMAAVSDKILAAPFALVGSIGVVAQVPNFHRLLKKNDIDIDIFTSGEFKRTVTLFGENTEAGKQKFQDELESVHDQFKALVEKYRKVDISKVSTGEGWLAEQAKELGLVDELITSDAYLMKACEEVDVFQVKWTPYLTATERIVNRAETYAGKWLGHLLQSFNFK